MNVTRISQNEYIEYFGYDTNGQMILMYSKVIGKREVRELMTTTRALGRFGQVIMGVQTP